MDKKTFFVQMSSWQEKGRWFVYDLGRTMPAGICVLLDVKGEELLKKLMVNKMEGIHYSLQVARGATLLLKKFHVLRSPRMINKFIQ